MGDYVLDFSFLTVITTCAEVEPRSTSLKLIRRMNVDIIRKKKEKSLGIQKQFAEPNFERQDIFKALLPKLCSLSATANKTR